MADSSILVKGARQHNLKNVDVVIPRDELVVITGLSGSGKSSLAFDTIYAEGQRRYVESLSAYARQFLGQMDKPDVDYITGLSPAISIDQKGVSHNPRSTVGTVTETYDYLRLLYARIGRPHCPNCGRTIEQQTVEQIVDAVLALAPGTRLMILGPLVRHRKGEHLGIFEEVRKAGFIRVRVDGELHDVSTDFKLDKYKNHSIEVVVDRLAVPEPSEGTEARADVGRIADSVETALRLGGGTVLVAPQQGEELLFSEHFACGQCGISLPEIAPRNFSFNSPHGACPTCTGLGSRLEVDPTLVVPHPEKSLAAGAVAPWFRGSSGENYYLALLEGLASEYGFALKTPWEKLEPHERDLVLYGSDDRRVRFKPPANGRRHHHHRGRGGEYSVRYEGVVPNLERRYKETESDWVRGEIERYMTTQPCPDCGGARLKPESLAVTVAGRPIVEVTGMSIATAARFFALMAEHAPLPVDLGARAPHRWPSERGAVLTERESTIARQILKEIQARLGFLVDVGLDYLTLDRTAGTLSGGEAQRIRLATQIGSGLMGVLYILDEPSIGLHQRDNDRLIRTLKRLRDLGNTVIVVEHDEETIREADHLIDIGPGAGEHGGEVVATGTVHDLMAAERSITGQYLSGAMSVPVPESRRPGNGKALRVHGARANNLKNLDVRIPLGKFVAVTGVSGSGKSSLVNEVLYKALARELYGAHARPGAHERIEGLEFLDKVIDIDQSPIGRTPRSNPATYTGAFTPIRELFAAVPEARVRGYLPGRFSFNVKGGRCEACRGEGIIQIEMQFLPDVYVPCEVCKGRRYNREALEVHYKGKTIADVLDMTVAEACTFFEPIPAVRNKLQTLNDVGLGYIRVGQPATTLSGGEAQRVKLSAELSRRATGRTLYILDEPTTGLHFADVRRLLEVLNRLVETGNTVVVIEHNLDVIKTADWLIDLGPEGGDAGGRLLAEGTPEEVAASNASYTGSFVRRVLGLAASAA
jgi:excinuclease ABC subunit A